MAQMQQSTSPPAVARKAKSLMLAQPPATSDVGKNTAVMSTAVSYLVRLLHFFQGQD
jgi:hypothetical protein